MKVLEIVCLENGDVVLVEAASETEIDVGDVSDTHLQEDQRAAAATEPPLVSIRFSPEVRDMLGDDSLGVAEAMIEAATAYISDEADSISGEFSLEQLGLEQDGLEQDGLDQDDLNKEGLERRRDRIDPDLDDFEDQVSTAPVVLH